MDGIGILLPYGDGQPTKVTIMPLCEHTMKVTRETLLREAVAYIYAEASECAPDPWWKQLFSPLQSLRAMRRRMDVSAMKEIVTIIAAVRPVEVVDDGD